MQNLDGKLQKITKTTESTMKIYCNSRTKEHTTTGNARRDNRCAMTMQARSSSGVHLADPDCLTKSSRKHV